MSRKDIFISIATVAAVFCMIIFGIKNNVFSLKSKSNNMGKDNENMSSETGESNNKNNYKENKTRNDVYNKFNDNIYKIGDEAISEYILKDSKGNVKKDSRRFKIKYIETTISKDLPEGMELSFYLKDELNNIFELHEDNPTKTLTSNYSYLTFTFDITNISEETWTDNEITPAGIRIVKKDAEDKMKSLSEERKIVSTEPNMYGIFYIKRGDTVRITNYYIISDEDIKNTVMYAWISLNGGVSSNAPELMAMEEKNSEIFYIIDTENNKNNR